MPQTAKAWIRRSTRGQARPPRRPQPGDPLADERPFAAARDRCLSPAHDAPRCRDSLCDNCDDGASARPVDVIWARALPTAVPVGGASPASRLARRPECRRVAGRRAVRERLDGCLSVRRSLTHGRRSRRDSRGPTEFARSSGSRRWRLRRVGRMRSDDANLGNVGHRNGRPGPRETVRAVTGARTLCSLFPLAGGSDSAATNGGSGTGVSSIGGGAASRSSAADSIGGSCRGRGRWGHWAAGTLVRLSR